MFCRFGERHTGWDVRRRLAVGELRRGLGEPHTHGSAEGIRRGPGAGLAGRQRSAVRWPAPSPAARRPRVHAGPGGRRPHRLAGRTHPRCPRLLRDEGPPAALSGGDWCSTCATGIRRHPAGPGSATRGRFALSTRATTLIRRRVAGVRPHLPAGTTCSSSSNRPGRQWCFRKSRRTPGEAPPHPMRPPGRCVPFRKTRHRRRWRSRRFGGMTACRGHLPWIGPDEVGVDEVGVDGVEQDRAPWRRKGRRGPESPSGPRGGARGTS